MFGWLSTTWGVMCIDSFSFSSSRRSYILSLQTGVLALGHIAGSRLWRPSGVPKRIQRAGALMCYWPGKLDSIIIIHWMHIHSRPNQHELPWGTHPLDTTRPGPYRYIYIYMLNMYMYILHCDIVYQGQIIRACVTAAAAMSLVRNWKQSCSSSWTCHWTDMAGNSGDLRQWAKGRRTGWTCLEKCTRRIGAWWEPFPTAAPWIGVRVVKFFFWPG